jgi:hypothetical protein
VQRTAYARETLDALEGVSALHDQPVVREFAIALGVSGLAGVKRVIARCAAEHVNPGLPARRDYPEYPDGLLVAVTEQRSRAPTSTDLPMCLAARLRPSGRTARPRAPARTIAHELS